MSPNSSGRDACSQTKGSWRIETCCKQNPGSHPRGGVRGLACIATPSSANLSGDTKQTWRMGKRLLPGLRSPPPLLHCAGSQNQTWSSVPGLELPATRSSGSLHHLLSPCAGFPHQIRSCLSFELPSPSYQALRGQFLPTLVSQSSGLMAVSASVTTYPKQGHRKGTGNCEYVTPNIPIWGGGAQGEQVEAGSCMLLRMAW